MFPAPLLLTLLLTPAPDDPAAHVKAILTAKCTQCHGPTLPRPKGKFGFVTDLKRLADHPDYIVPGDPESSYLWTQIEDGEMPPEKAKAGPLTDEEKQAIVAWIKAGAVPPADDPGANPLSTARSAETDSPASPAPKGQEGRTPFQRAAELLGKLHILTIHFPIALLAGAAIAETCSALRRSKSPSPSVRFCLSLGACAAVVAAGLGWIHASYLTDEPVRPLFLHRWIGTGVGVLGPMVAVLSEQDYRAGSRRIWVRIAIIGLGIGAGVAGHFGGLLVYGSNFLSF